MRRRWRENSKNGEEEGKNMNDDDEDEGKQ